MERVVRKFNSHQDAALADRDYYLSLTPAQLVDIFSWTWLLDAGKMPVRLDKDLREFIELLNSHHIEHVVVGAPSLAFHGHPRYTGDAESVGRIKLSLRCRVRF